MTTREDDDESARWSYRFLDYAKDAVSRNGVETPRWFDVRLTNTAWPTEIVVSVVMHPDAGPVLTGIRTGRDSATSPQEAAKLLRGWMTTADLLQWLTAQAVGVRATAQLLESHPEHADGIREHAREIRDLHAARALPVARPQRRRAVTGELLRQVAAVYRKAVTDGEPPTTTVAGHFGVSHSTAARWVGQARKAGALGPAAGPTAGEVKPSE
jgi:hypothetical protein